MYVRTSVATMNNKNDTTVPVPYGRIKIIRSLLGDSSKNKKIIQLNSP